jgi:glucan phosphoethanolaminetransferase (alkaline phosphatase superfamily)
MRHLSLLTLLLLPACSPERSLPQGPAQRVIVISCDTLRADRLGCYGYPLPTSPTLDALARESTLYRSAWTTAPWTRDGGAHDRPHAG